MNGTPERISLKGLAPSPFTIGDLAATGCLRPHCSSSSVRSTLFPAAFAATPQRPPPGSPRACRDPAPPKRASCCGPTRCVLTPRWWPPMSGIRPIRGCSPRASGRCVAAWRGSKTLGGATRTQARDRRRAAGRRARSIASRLRLRAQQQRDQAQAAVRRITGELADIAEAAMRDADTVIRNAGRALGTATGARKGQLQQAINHLATVVGRRRQVVAQTRSRLAGPAHSRSAPAAALSLHRVGRRRIHALPAARQASRVAGRGPVGAFRTAIHRRLTRSAGP
jgi:hypothetical protein